MYEYKGNTVKTTDPAGKWKRMTTDEFGNTVQVNEPDPVTTGQEYTTTYQYDLLNHLVKASLPRPTAGGTYTQLRTWTYDPATQRLSSQTLPEMTKPTSFTYNANGLLATKVDANGTRKSFTYDTSRESRRCGTTSTRAGVEYTDKRVDYYWDTNPFDGATR